MVGGVDGEGGYKDDSQCRGEGQRQPRREHAREDANQCRAEHEGELVRGALVGQGGVQVRGVCGRPAPGRPGGQRHPADPGQRADLRAACPGDEGRGQHGDGGGEVLCPGNEVCREDQGDDGHGVRDGGHEQDAALAEPVGEDAEDGSTECGTDADGSGGGAAHSIGTVTAVTSVRAPTVSMASGRRAKRPSGMKLRPASSGSLAKRPPLAGAGAGSAADEIRASVEIGASRVDAKEDGEGFMVSGFAQ